MPKAKPFAPLRIFLSYSHDSNEELLRRIKADLEKRGHDVWFDETPEEAKSIRAGDDWRRAITDGILGNLHTELQKLVRLSKRATALLSSASAVARLFEAQYNIGKTHAHFSLIQP